MTYKTINEFIENPSKNTDDCFGFHDWFSPDRYLEKKMLSMVPKLKYLVKAGILNGDTTRVWFKENCTITDKSTVLNVDMRFNRIKDDKFLGGINPNVGKFMEHNIELWYFTDDTFKGLHQNKHENWKSFKDKIKNDNHYRNELTNAYA
jgi:hypothetical protein